MSSKSRRTNKAATAATTAPSPQNTARPWRIAKIATTAVSAVYLVLAIWMNLASPLSYENYKGRRLSSNPDEIAHLLNVNRVASGHLPVFHANQDDYEAHQPPLYYVLAAPLDLAARAHTSDANAEARIVRILNIVLGVALIWLTFLAVKRVFPDEPAAAVGAAGFVGLLPTNVALSASVSNDVLTNVVIAAGLFQLARIAMMPADQRDSASLKRESIVMGVLLGVGIWTKTSTLLMFPVALTVIYFLARRQILTTQAAVRGSAIAVGLGVLIGAPWLIRNTILYGDPVAQHIFVSAFQNTATAKSILNGAITGYPLTFSAYITWVTMWTYQSFWFKRGFVPDGMFSAAGIVAAASLAGALWYLARVARRLSAEQAASLAGWLVLIALTLVGFLRFNLSFFQAQGRYLFTALVPIAALSSLGLRTIVPVARGGIVAAVLIAALIVFNVVMIQTQTAVVPPQ